MPRIKGLKEALLKKKAFAWDSIQKAGLAMYVIKAEFLCILQQQQKVVTILTFPGSEELILLFKQ